MREVRKSQALGASLSEVWFGEEQVTSDEDLIARVREAHLEVVNEACFLENRHVGDLPAFEAAKARFVQALDTLARRLEEGTEKDYVTVHTSTGKPLAVTASDAQELEEDVLALQARIEELREGLEEARHLLTKVCYDQLHNGGHRQLLEEFEQKARSLLHPEPQGETQ